MSEGELCKCLEKSNISTNGLENNCSRCKSECEALDWRWRCHRDSSVALISRGGSLITFHQRYSSGTAAVRGDTPLLPDRHYYWELHMCNALYGTDIMVGVGTQNVALDTSTYKFASLLGLDSESWGYSYSGRIQHAGKMYQYGPRFGLGDVVGVHLDMWYGTLSFFLNRKPLGIAFRGLREKRVLYPMVCSTAAQISMVLVLAASVPSSLLLHSSRALVSRPATLRALQQVPGLKAIFSDVFWLLLIEKVTFYDDDDQDMCQFLWGGGLRPFFTSNGDRQMETCLPEASCGSPQQSADSGEDTSPETSYRMQTATDDADIDQVYANLSGNSEDECTEPDPITPGTEITSGESRVKVSDAVSSGVSPGPSEPTSGFRTLPCESCHLKSAITIKGEDGVTSKCLRCFYNQKTGD